MRMPALSNSRSVLLRRRDSAGFEARWLRHVEIVFLVLAAMPQLFLSTSVAGATVSPAATDEVPPAVTGPSPGLRGCNHPGSRGALGANTDENLLLEVEINGHSIGKIGEFTLRGGKLMAQPGELRDLGIQVPLSRAGETGGLISLSDLPGLSWSLDEKNQILRITASDSALVPAVLLPFGQEEKEAARRVIESGKGLTLNYDVAGSCASGQTGATGSFDLRAFSPWGVASSDWLVYAGATKSSSGANTAIRLDSAYSFADVNSLRRYTVGDFITSGLSWTRPIHLEGAQIRSDFSMRPDLVTFPLPIITGSAAVPSTVSVLIDGNQALTRSTDAGPFEIPELPVVSGAGTISMTVTNALGQQVSISQSFYASNTLLAPGLQTFAGEAGLARLNWGSISNDYGTMAGTAIYRRGLSRKFTIEGTVQGAPGMGLGGAGGVLQLRNLGVINFAAAANAGSGHSGTLFSLGAQRLGKFFSLGASAIIASANSQDIASLNGTPVPRKQINANASVSAKRYGSIGVAYAGIAQDSASNPIPQNSIPSLRSSVVSANYTVQIHRFSIYATEFRNYGSSSSNGFQGGVTILLGRRRSASAGGSSTGTGQAQVQQSATKIGEWGYQAYVSEGSSEHEFAQGQYKSHVGLFTAGADHNSGQTTLRLESQAAISLVDGGLFASNYIYDSFAIVDTNPVARVRVLQENRDVGRTDRQGRLLVPDMRSFDLNHIAIEATDIPADATIRVAKRDLRPQDRSGVVIKFPIHFNRAALLQLVDEAGVPLPPGSTATLQATGAVVPVGYDGDAYVEDLSSHNELVIELPNGKQCKAVFNYEPIAGDIPSIGPLHCQEKPR